MKPPINEVWVVVPLMLATVSVLAGESQSTSYKLEGVLNAGGRPDDGATATSAGFRASLDSLGDAIMPRALASASFRVDGGFAATFPPPGEVLDLRFADNQSLEWDPERSVGVYHLYRGALTDLAGLGYGGCEQPGLTQPGTSDTDTPLANEAYFYLVTAENRLGEQGIKGIQSNSTMRAGATCP